MQGGLGQNSNLPSGSIDKTRVLDVKPLRTLDPVFPNSARATTFDGACPTGFYSFFPFGASQGPQASPPKVPMPAPLRSFRSSDTGEATPAEFPVASNGENTDSHDRAAPNKSRSSKKKPKISQDLQIDVSSLLGIGKNEREDGNRELVNLLLMTFDALRRRIGQLEDSKELTLGLSKRADMRAGNILMSAGIRTNLRKRIGAVPGVEIGDIFFFRLELCIVGLHSQSMGGIDYTNMGGKNESDPLALAIVSSGKYNDNAEDSDILIYSGQGGDKGDDQKLERGNLALDRSLRQKTDVRVIRGMKDQMNSTSKVYIYDGLYKIQDSWVEKGKSGGGVFKYKLVRVPGQPRAFAAWKSIEKWKGGIASRTGLILADLSSGAEKIPVSLVNDFDDEKAPGYFTYLHSLRYSKSFIVSHPYDFCNCQKDCIPGDLNCSCIRRNEGDFPYTGNGILVSRKKLVYECGLSCQCSPNCKNRVSQTGLKYRMEVFKTKDRGWGLRSLDPIRAGTFICEYAGEVIDRARVRWNGNNDEYVFDTTRIYQPFKWNYEPKLLEEASSNDSSEDYDIPSPVIISAKNVGNVARFMNHSCSPNVFWQPVLYEENNQPVVHISFFALRHIPPLTELTYDYGAARSDSTVGHIAPRWKKKCLCASSKCRGSFG
ncbi:histone-lysine N-methyltransferase, H3 lysine-9 specific SUVH1 isoform X1 [Neltuma alba]|uniref:histone-lysine N-methyltransferase, H3 lysine-9 specific SUVH1 isoform X1 n=2 Tax=Neltuma alba TaxID=207710 RepID=UPI0010A39BCB|nr:histone-lysine N-methyltransferase, H3 lysine-9 specific SUVH1-like isoform X1 [Prosopis alba]